MPIVLDSENYIDFALAGFFLIALLASYFQHFENRYQKCHPNHAHRMPVGSPSLIAQFSVDYGSCASNSQFPSPKGGRRVEKVGSSLGIDSWHPVSNDL